MKHKWAAPFNPSFARPSHPSGKGTGPGQAPRTHTLSIPEGTKLDRTGSQSSGQGSERKGKEHASKRGAWAQGERIKRRLPGIDPDEIDLESVDPDEVGGLPVLWDSPIGSRKWRGRLQRLERAPGAIGAFLPNVVTLSSLCLGLSAIAFAFSKDWRQAVASVLIAGVLDGLDGRLARMLKVSSEFGAQLDSLADFINFGVAPALILYCSFFHTWGRRGWGLCLFFAICMALRLARFNVQRHKAAPSTLFSVGVPAPAGALMVLSPLLVEFVFQVQVPTAVVALWSLLTSGLLISRYPTFVFKKISVSPRHLHFVWAGVLALLAGLVGAPWETLLTLGILYVLSIPVSGYWARHRKGAQAASS